MSGTCRCETIAIASRNDDNFYPCWDLWFCIMNEIHSSFIHFSTFCRKIMSSSHFIFQHHFGGTFFPFSLSFFLQHSYKWSHFLDVTCSYTHTYLEKSKTLDSLRMNERYQMDCVTTVAQFECLENICTFCDNNLALRHN